jgi:hypothetical protein
MPEPCNSSIHNEVSAIYLRLNCAGLKSRNEADMEKIRIIELANAESKHLIRCTSTIDTIATGFQAEPSHHPNGKTRLRITSGLGMDVLRCKQINLHLGRLLPPVYTMVLLGRRCTAYLLVDEGRTVVTHHISYQHSKVSEAGIKYARIVSTVWAFIELTREHQCHTSG